MKWLISILSISLVSGELRAQECRCNSIEGSIESVFDTVTQKGHQLRLRFESDPVTTKSKLAFLCTDSAASPSQAKLWMPDMGHGSSPTKLVAAANSCTRVEKINFLMEGAWEIRIKLSDNDIGTFNFDVNK